MKALNLKTLTPYLTAIGVFIVLILVYFSPIFSGKVISQSDHSSYLGAVQEVNKYVEQTDTVNVWTNSMFSGMPSTSITNRTPGNLVYNATEPLRLLPHPMSELFIGITGFFVLLIVFGVNPWLSLVGAIAFAFCAYNFQIIQVGHNTKLTAMMYMPWVFSAMVYTLRKNMFVGFLWFAAALSLEIMANHPQVTYYLAFMLFAYWISELVMSIKDKTVARLTKATLLLCVGALLAVGTNVHRLWPIYEYSKYTMRGGSELNKLNPNTQQSKSGLDIEYATAWSYGVGETMNLLIPNMYGGSSGGALTTKSETYKFLKQNGAPNADEIVQQLPLYWGPQPFTAGPMYMGAVTIFLFVLGLFLIKGGMKWWIVGITLLAILLAWGKHFLWFSTFFYNYVPMYSKFRVPSMILILLQVTLPLLGFYALNRLLTKDIDKKVAMNALKKAFIVVGGLCLLYALVPSIAGSFTAPGDAQYPEWLRQLLPADRAMLLRTDAFRSLIIVVVTAFAIYLAYNGKIKRGFLYVILGATILFDMWGVDRRYLNDNHFVTERNFHSAFEQRAVDKFILKDGDIHYRVLDLAVNTFNDSHSAYHHKLIGGYSAAKLQRYQDLIDLYIQREISAFAKAYQNGVSEDSLFNTMPVVSMLNGKYIIINPNAPALVNTQAYGNGWFVENVIPAANADEEIALLGSINPHETAIVGVEFKDVVKSASKDSSATITLTSYRPDIMEYKVKTTKDGVALFSEIYYPKGWKAYIDGVETPIFRANYVLRGLNIPAGEHEVRFVFRPDSYIYGSIIAYVCSGIILVLLLGYIVFATVSFFKKKD
ncbi:MAG: YfhO family protein [Marinifilaceae bacterium]